MRAFLTDFGEMLQAMVLALIILYVLLLPLWGLVMLAINFDWIIESIKEYIFSISKDIPVLPHM